MKYIFETNDKNEAEMILYTSEIHGLVYRLLEDKLRRDWKYNQEIQDDVREYITDDLIPWLLAELEELNIQIF